jgi:CheY-like chemotaxis protein
MSANTPLRVVIADDDASARRVIKYALEAVGIAVVAEATDGREAVELGLRHRPDIVVIDVVMPRLDGILATRRILEADPGQLVVVLTGVGEDELGLGGPAGRRRRCGAQGRSPRRARSRARTGDARERGDLARSRLERAVAKVLEHVDELFGDSADIVVYEPLEGGEAKKGSLAKHAGG